MKHEIPLAPGIISRQNGDCPALAFPSEKLLLTKAVPTSIWQVMALHWQANVLHEITETFCLNTGSQI